MSENTEPHPSDGYLLIGTNIVFWGLVGLSVASYWGMAKLDQHFSHANRPTLQDKTSINCTAQPGVK